MEREYVLAISNEGFEDALTVGKIYKKIKEDEDCVLIIDENKNKFWYSRSYFISCHPRLDIKLERINNVVIGTLIYDRGDKLNTPYIRRETNYNHYISLHCGFIIINKFGTIGASSCCYFDTNQEAQDYIDKMEEVLIEINTKEEVYKINYTGNLTKEQIQILKDNGISFTKEGE